MNIDDQIKLAVIVGANKIIYKGLDSFMQKNNMTEYAVRTQQINHLKTLPTSELAKAIESIEYRKDSLFAFLNCSDISALKLKDVEVQAIKPPQMTLRDGYGDCDDFAFLASAITGGQVFCFLTSIENKNSAGHFVCIDRYNNIWSKARKGDPGLDGKHKDIHSTAKKYVKRYKYIINLDPKTFKYTVIEKK